MLPRYMAAISAVVLLAPLATAQNHTILFSMDANELTLENGSGLVETGLLRTGELASVTPAPAVYSAKPFMTKSAQWAYIGDDDQDSLYVDNQVVGPGNGIDAVLVRSMDTGPFTPRKVFISKRSSADFFPLTIENGDVFCFTGPNAALEFFVHEPMLLGALGQNGPTDDLDLDAICQAPNGDVFVSFVDDEVVNGNGGKDGDLIRIRNSVITYDPFGNISHILPGTAQRAATEVELLSFISNSGVRASNGLPPVVTEFDLTALEIDPAGGSFTSASSGITIPNLLFAWEGETNNGTIVSTSGGGTIKSINGMQMGSTVGTFGEHVGLLPDMGGVSGLDGLALIAEQPPLLVMENYPSDLVFGTSVGPVYHRIEYSGATPLSNLFLLACLGPNGAGGVVTSQIFPVGELFTGVSGAVLVGTAPSDANGYGAVSVVLNDPGLFGTNFVVQAYDPAAFRLSTPAAIQFE